MKLSLVICNYGITIQDKNYNTFIRGGLGCIIISVMTVIISAMNKLIQNIFDIS